MRVLLFCLGLLLPATAGAQVVISEVMWAGTEVSSADEWLRVVNISDENVSLDGWSITKRGSDGGQVAMILFEEDAELSPGQAFLISNYPGSQSALKQEPDLVTSSVSLTNTKLLLQIVDSDGEVIDTVDDGSGIPFAGGKDPYRSMVRTDLYASGTLKENWHDEGEESVVSSSSSFSLQSSAQVSSSLVPFSGSSQYSSLSVTEKGLKEKSSSSLPIVGNNELKIVGILPNPQSEKRSDQKVRIAYSGGQKATLKGWTLDNREGGRHAISLTNVLVHPNSTREYSADWLGISFTPLEDSVRLFAPDGSLVSSIYWNSPSMDEVVRPDKNSEKKIQAMVVEMYGAEHMDVRLFPESFVGNFPQIERYWSRIATKYLHPYIALSLIGIDAVEKKIPPSLVGETVWIEPEIVLWNAQPEIQAYVYLENSELLQHAYLRDGFAQADRDSAHPHAQEFLALSIPDATKEVASSSSSKSTASSLSTEQIMYTTSSSSSLSSLPIPTRYINTPEVPEASSSSSFPEAYERLLKQSKRGLEPTENPQTSGFPWVILFTQSAVFVGVVGWKMIA
jgi:hypothetical protein